MLIGTKHSGYSRANIRLYFDPVTIMAAGSAEVAAITAAEIAAQQAIAAATAEAAMIASAEAAAATAATAATEAAATAATAANAAPAFNPAGIMEIGGTTAAPGATPLTAEAVQAAAQGAGQLPPDLAQQLQNVQNYMQGPSVDVATTNSTGGMEALQNLNARSAVPPTAGPEAMSFDSFGNPVPVSSPAYSSADPTGLAQMQLDANAIKGPNTFDKLLDYADKNPFRTGAAMYMGASKLGLLDPSKQTFNDEPYDGPLSKYRLSPDFKGSTATPNIYRPTYPTYAEGGSINLQGTFDMGGGQGGGQMGSSNNPQPFVGSNNAPSMMPQQGVTPLPGQDPKIRQLPTDMETIRQSMLNTRGLSSNVMFAGGGIMNAGPVQSMSDQNNALGYQQAMAATGGQVSNFAAGGKTGSLTDSLDYYKQMMGGKTPAAPSDRADVGIFRDSDPDTMYQDALTAAQIRNAKVNKRANLSVPSMKRPTPMGRINLAAPGIKSSDKEDVKEAAGGGIMGASNLGGYAAGGNPRLLKGPGDGMSDNIPAVIGKKQPARLADGEFVIPADVVSHLGNGSTEAGAKRLHEMMNKVRRDRTGNSKQGKQIVAAKYMPK